MKGVALEALRMATEHNDLLQEPVRRMGGLEDLALRVKACTSSLQKVPLLCSASATQRPLIETFCRLRKFKSHSVSWR